MLMALVAIGQDTNGFVFKVLGNRDPALCSLKVDVVWHEMGSGPLLLVRRGDTTFRMQVQPDANGHFEIGQLEEGSYNLLSEGGICYPDEIELVSYIPQRSRTVHIMQPSNALEQVYADMYHVIRAQYRSFSQFESKDRPDLMGIMAALPLLRVPEGMVVDGCMYGDPFGASVRPYLRVSAGYSDFDIDKECFKKNLLGIEEECLCDSTTQYTPQQRILGTYSEHLGHLPDVLEGLEVPFTEAGVWQAFLLKKADILLPRCWHALYGAGGLIFSSEEIEWQYNTKDLPRSVVPTKVELISQDTAMVTATVWNDIGVYEEHWQAVRSGKTVRMEMVDRSTVFNHGPSRLY